MLKNYLLLALRNLKSNKGFSLLNVAGLSLGITCALLIGLWIQDELHYDRFHKNYNTLYKVMENQTYEGKINTFGATPGPLAAALRAEFPEIANATRCDWGSTWAFAYRDKVINERGFITDPQFLEMFSFPLVKGEPSQVLREMYSLVITEQMARKFFGEEDPIGKSLRVNGEQDYIVTGILKNMPENSSITLEWLASYQAIEAKDGWIKNWGSNSLQTFVQLKDGADPEQLNVKLQNFIKQKEPTAVAEPILWAMKDWRLWNDFEDGKLVGGRIEYIRLFGIIAIVIIIIACINFMNLATARSEQRAKEIGVRKVIGATRKMLIGQFITESVLMAFFATVLAMGITYLVLPLFNDLIERELRLDLTDPALVMSLLAITLLSGLLAGSYPSIYLSSFKPVHAFKRMQGGKNATPVVTRKVLVIVQFIASIVLIIATIVLYLQVKHVMSRDMGYNRKNIITTGLKGNMLQHMDALQNELKNTGVVEESSTSSSHVLALNSNGWSVKWKGKPEDQMILITHENVSPGYLGTFGMKLMEGRNFYGKHDSSSVIINEALARMISSGSVVGEVITARDKQYKIAGVVKDFVYQDMYAVPPMPLIFFCTDDWKNYLNIRIKDGANLKDALKKIEKVMKASEPFIPFEYTFVEDDFVQAFSVEMFISDLSKLFAVLAIFISCIGLFGLSAYTAERRTKEIGIRKVLGASVTNIVLMLSKDFLLLVVIATFIAFPLAWWIMSSYLEEYTYHVDIPIWVFVAAGTCAFTVAVFTICFQGIKTARLNPVKNLRTE